MRADKRLRSLASRQPLRKPVADWRAVTQACASSEAVEQGGRHFRIAEDRRRFAKGQVRGDDDRGSLVEAADEVEQQLAASLGEGQIAPSRTRPPVS